MTISQLNTINLLAYQATPMNASVPITFTLPPLTELQQQGNSGLAFAEVFGVVANQTGTDSDGDSATASTETTSDQLLSAPNWFSLQVENQAVTAALEAMQQRLLYANAMAAYNYDWSLANEQYLAQQAVATSLLIPSLI
jgi:hypothetical protein